MYLVKNKPFKIKNCKNLKCVRKYNNLNLVLFLLKLYKILKK